jgi:hypothetical protein
MTLKTGDHVVWRDNGRRDDDDGICPFRGGDSGDWVVEGPAAVPHPLDLAEFWPYGEPGPFYRVATDDGPLVFPESELAAAPEVPA